MLKGMNFEVSSRFAQEDFCRLCLCSIYELQTLFPGNAGEANSLLLQKISLLAEINIVPAEESNSRICSRCVQLLEEFDSFRRRCKDSDSQIRQIRAFRRSRNANDSGFSVDGEGQQNGTGGGGTNPGFGGVFDSFEYCADGTFIGEYQLLYDGYVYRRGDSLLVWRCELPVCPCQLFVQSDYGKVKMYRAHNHGKVPLENDTRKFVKMNQHICEFLTKLRHQNDGTRDHGLVNKSQTSNAKQPVRLTSDSANIQYYAAGGRPIIFMAGQQYYKEAATDNNMQSQLYWRCSEKNCLGLITTSVDLRKFRVLMNHNHESRSVRNTNENGSDLPLINRAPDSESTALKPIAIEAMQGSDPPQISVGPCGIDPSPKPNESDKSTSDLPPLILQKALSHLGCHSSYEDDAPMVTSTESPNQQGKEKEKSNESKHKTMKLSSTKVLPNGILFYRDHARTYYMRYKQRFYYKDVSKHAKVSGSATIWRCISKSCLVTITVRTNMKLIQDFYHNHGYIKGVTTSRRLTEVKSSEALMKLPIVPDIAFYRCTGTQDLCLLYEQFSYSLQSRHLDSGFFIWNCLTASCDAWLHSGTELEYLVRKNVHNHDVPADQTVDVELHVTVSDALRILMDLKNGSQNTSLSENATTSAADEFQRNPEQNSCKGYRRKSTWC